MKNLEQKIAAYDTEKMLKTFGVNINTLKNLEGLEPYYTNALINIAEDMLEDGELTQDEFNSLNK